MYDHKQIEEKWLAFWEEKQLFQDTAHFEANRDKEKVKSRVEESFSEAEKLYLLFAFAYPSGAGLHVGHVESSTALDILARYYRMNGKQVFLPVGWDAFGLPAENYAVKTGVPPAVTTKNAITTFRRQVKRVGISYDWANEIATSHPGYYRWTQWLFLQLFNKGMAYQGTGMVNWCSSCQTVLANEQVVDGTCERCGTQVMQKDMKQWFFKITEYRDELISGLDQVDWPHATKQQQLNWIGKKEGINITYQIEGTDEAITCFTTRPDTNFGATFIVVAPEHALAKQVAAGELVPDVNGETVRSSVTDYLEKASRKTELERQSEGKKKSGAFTGFYAINNLNGMRLPIWVSDFVLGGFGTGAVVGVPAHDKRDFLFAQQFSIPIIRVVVGKDGDASPIEKEEQVQEEEGTMVNSDFLDGLEIHEATKVIMDHLEGKGWGERVTSYKLRDWLISRQRYWGAPIPVVYDPEGQPHPVKEEHLPWLLPTDVDFKPTGESPLRSSKEFIERTERLYGKGWRPEFDTMDTFVDSSWYYLRYVSSRNEEAFSDGKQMADWLPVDFYMIGPEHIVLHLLYSRFFTKFLRDEGHLNFSEPFQKMRHQGMILGPDGKKMSKSKGNVINPDEIIEKFGADCLRMYEMFMGPIESDKPWNVTAVMGVYRFLQRLESTISAELSASEQTMSVAGEMRAKVRQKLHNTLKKVTLDIPASKFNTAIASLMELLNEWEAARRQVGEKRILTQEELSLVVRMIAPFAPFLAEELWQQLPEDLSASQRRAGEELPSVHLTVWPAFDYELAKPANVVIPVQINGKVRAKLHVVQELLIEHAVILEQALSHPDVLKHIDGKKIKKQLYIAGKIVSIATE